MTHSHLKSTLYLSPPYSDAPLQGPSVTECQKPRGGGLVLTLPLLSFSLSKHAVLLILPARQPPDSSASLDSFTWFRTHYFPPEPLQEPPKRSLIFSCARPGIPSLQHCHDTTLIPLLMGSQAFGGSPLPMEYGPRVKTFIVWS